jgi:hypothetical protein
MHHGNTPHQVGGTQMETSDNYTFINSEIRNKVPIIYSHWISKKYKSG